ncbi:hypothetical protein Tco_0936044 [Tanacetum coccineum]
MYFSPPSITTVRPWFATIGYNGEIRAKGTLKKSCLPPRWRLLMGQIIQCLGGKICGLDQISNKDATILYCLANGVQVDYAKLIWEDLIHKLNKKTREKILPYPQFISLLLEHMMPGYDNEELTINLTQVFSVHNWTLKLNQPEEPPFTTHMKAICKLDVPMVSKAPKPTSQTEEVPQGKKPGAKKTKSSSDKDKIPSHPSPPALVVGEMHKEAQQAVGGPTSLGVTSEEGAHPQDIDKGTKNYSFDHIFAGSNLSVLVDKTKSAEDGLKTAHTDSDTRSAFFTPDSLQDEPIIVTDESKEKDADKEETRDTSHDMPEDTSVPPPTSPKSTQIQELMAQVQLLKSQKDELEQQKATAEAEVASLKVRPSYPDVNTLLLFWFVTMVENASEATTKDVPSAGQATASPTKGEKNTKDADTNLKDELVDLLGANVVTQEDGSEKVILNLKVSDLHLAEWREVIQACPNKSEKEWKTVYDLVKTKLDQLTQTEQELKIDLNKPLKEQDPLNELNELGNKKRKRTSDLKDHSRTTKKHSHLVQHKEEKLKRVVSLLEGLQGGKKIALGQKE